MSLPKATYRRRFVLLAPLALAACGFQPVYGPGGNGQLLQNRIEVDPPNARYGYFLTREIEQKLGRSASPAYGLAVNVSTNEERLAINRAGETTRFDLIGSVDYALRDLETHEVKEMEGLTFIEGMAKFTAPKKLAVTDVAGETTEYTADNIVIATGARPRQLKIEGLPAERYMTNIELFDTETAPKHLVVVGAGVIALEMAFAFEKLGTKVTLFALDKRALTTSIPEAAEAIQVSLDRKGITSYFGTSYGCRGRNSRRICWRCDVRSFIKKRNDSRNGGFTWYEDH